jgi:hypothetical protein
MLRLVLSFLLVIFTSQVWSVGAASSKIYDYDVCSNLFIGQNTTLKQQDRTDDGPLHFRNSGNNQPAASIESKPRVRVFLGFLGDFDVAKGEGTVIGRVKDLQNLKKGEKSLLDRLPNQGSPKANWKQNSGVLREEMSKGKPIRDASPDDFDGPFLNAERYLLKDRGWTFDPKSNYWNPPAQ